MGFAEDDSRSELDTSLWSPKLLGVVQVPLYVLQESRSDKQAVFAAVAVLVIVASPCHHDAQVVLDGEVYAELNL